MNCKECYWFDQCGIANIENCIDFTPLGDDMSAELAYKRDLEERHTIYEATISSFM